MRLQGDKIYTTALNLLFFLTREVYQDMEQGLEILGATAIEDKLQVVSPLTKF